MIRIATSVNGKRVVIEQPIPPVTAFQGKVILQRRGLFDAAEGIATAAGGETLFAWDRAQEWRRDSPTIVFLSAELGLSDDDLDALFIEAAQIAV
jgi:hypothetical protein